MKYALLFFLSLMTISCQGTTIDLVNQEQNPNQENNTGNNGNQNTPDNGKPRTLIPADKSLNYAANNYRIGTEQLTRIQENPNNESSYPAIDPVDVDLSKYNVVIIATPLWWSQMASNMQTFLFKFGKKMAGKHIGLVVD